MNKLLLILIPLFTLVGCSINRPVSPQNTAYSNIINEQQVKKNKIASIIAAQGSPWIYVGESVTNDKYYVNVESIKKSYGTEYVMQEGSIGKTTSQTTKAWWKIVSTDNTYAQIQSDFYCLVSAAKNTSIVEYSASSQYISSPQVGIYASSIIPNTTFSNVYNLVCELS